MRKLWRDMDKPLFIICMIFFLFGTLNIVTSSSSEAIKYHISIYSYFIKQIVFLCVGLVFTWIIINIPTKKWRRLASLVYIGVVFLLFYLSVSGVSHRGATNWIDLGFFSIQPSELAKPVLIVCLALMFDYYYNDLKSIDNKIRYNVLLKIFVLGIVPMLFVFLEKDLGSMTIILGIFAGMFLFSPILLKDKIKIFWTSIILVVVVALTLIFIILLADEKYATLYIIDGFVMLLLRLVKSF